jgi:hypothetical protein
MVVPFQNDVPSRTSSLGEISPLPSIKINFRMRGFLFVAQFLAGKTIDGDKDTKFMLLLQRIIVCWRDSGQQWRHELSCETFPRRQLLSHFQSSPTAWH